jgi:hypothetical protein
MPIFFSVKKITDVAIIVTDVSEMSLMLLILGGKLDL